MLDNDADFFVDDDDYALESHEIEQGDIDDSEDSE